MTVVPARGPGQIRLLVGGDLMLGRGIDFLRPVHNDPDFGKVDARHPEVTVAWARARGASVPMQVSASQIWGEALAPILSCDADLTLFNLETAVTSRDCWRPKTYNFRMHPAGLDVLKEAGVQCVSLANNHVLDFGLPGLLDTMSALRERGIATAGAGLNVRAARAPTRLSLPGERRALVFAMACFNAGCHPWEAALPHRPGLALLPDLEPATADAVCRLIRTFRQPDDLVVVSIHWGGNWPETVPETMRSFAQRLVRQAGVNLIHGHSSHWPMAVEQIDAALVLYGCGDVLNDYEGRADFLSRRADLGVVFVVDYDATTLELTGWNRLAIRRQGFCLRLVNPAETQLLDARLRGDSLC